jgi:hypothetical protein
MPHLIHVGRGVHKQMPHLGDVGMGETERRLEALKFWMRSLQDRLRGVRVCCGDWERVCGSPSTVTANGLAGVFLDPPYSGEAGRDNAIYAHEDLTVAHDVREWCLLWGDNPRVRIALCGYEGEHEELERRGWSVLTWKTQGGYANVNRSGDAQGKANAHRERIWFSPACLSVESESLFGGEE